MGGKAAPDRPRLLPGGLVDAAAEASRDDVSVALSIDSPPSLHRSAVKGWRGGARHRSGAGAAELRDGFGEGSKGNARGGPHGGWEEGGSAVAGGGLAASSVEMLGMLSVSLQVRVLREESLVLYVSYPVRIRPHMAVSRRHLVFSIRP